MGNGPFNGAFPVRTGSSSVSLLTTAGITGVPRSQETPPLLGPDSRTMAVGPYSKPMPRALWWSYGGGGCFL